MDQQTLSLSPGEAAALNSAFNAAPPGVESTARIITWAAERFMPALASTSSFQTQSAVFRDARSRFRGFARGKQRNDFYESPDADHEEDQDGHQAYISFDCFMRHVRFLS